jgi:hypothetical protein
MKAIKEYVEQKNKWITLFGQPALSLLDAKDRQRIAQSLDADLSPENLTCDGELRGAELQKRYTFLTKAARELKTIDPSVEIYEF